MGVEELHVNTTFGGYKCTVDSSGSRSLDIPHSLILHCYNTARSDTRSQDLETCVEQIMHVAARALTGSIHRGLATNLDCCISGFPDGELSQSDDPIGVLRQEFDKFQSWDFELRRESSTCQLCGRL